MSSGLQRRSRLKALTIWQPWASLISIGAKPYEFRRWGEPAHNFNQRIAIHAGKRPARRCEIQDLIDRLKDDEAMGTALVVDPALELLERVIDMPGSLPHAAVVCTAFLGTPRKVGEIFSGPVADSDRLLQHTYAWPLSSIKLLDPPEPARGKQSFWNWTPPASVGVAS